MQIQDKVTPIRQAPLIRLDPSEELSIGNKRSTRAKLPDIEALIREMDEAGRERLATRIWEKLLPGWHDNVAEVDPRAVDLTIATYLDIAEPYRAVIWYYHLDRQWGNIREACSLAGAVLLRAQDVTDVLKNTFGLRPIKFAVRSGGRNFTIRLVGAKQPKH